MKVWQAPFKKVSGVSHKNITKEMLTSLWLSRKADFVNKLLKKIRTAENNFFRSFEDKSAIIDFDVFIV